MRKKLIGRKHFEGILDVTDPCYDKDVWCRMRTPVPVKSGEYECRIWRHTDTCVGIIGIYLEGFIPPQKSMEEIGSIGVDAGLAGFFMDKPDYNDEQWSAFCNSIRNGDAWVKDEGFFSFSGYGDGCYPVYAFKDKMGDIIALEIRFI